MEKTVSAGDFLYFVGPSDNQKIVLAHLGRSIGEDTYKQGIKILRNIVTYNAKFESNLEKYFPVIFSKRKVLKNDQIWTGLEAMYLLILMSRRPDIVGKGRNLYAILWREEDFFKLGARNDSYIKEKRLLIDGITEDVDFFRKVFKTDHCKDDTVFDIRSLKEKMAIGENYTVLKAEHNAGIRVNAMINEFMRYYASKPEKFDKFMDLLIKMSARYIYYGLYEYFETNERRDEINMKIKELEALKKTYHTQFRLFNTSSCTPEQVRERYLKVATMNE